MTGTYEVHCVYDIQLKDALPHGPELWKLTLVLMLIARLLLYFVASLYCYHIII